MLELPDLRRVGLLALDTETYDAGLAAEHGSSWPWRDGYIVGLSVAYRVGNDLRAHYFPLRHPDSQNFEREPFVRWLRNLVASEVRIITFNGIYDWGWIWSDFDIAMPPADRLEEVGALAVLADENRYSFSLDALCRWRKLPTKDDTLLRESCFALGLVPGHRKKFEPRAHIYQLPAALVGPYAEQDVRCTLLLYESLRPIIASEGTELAYRLEVHL